MPDVNLSRSWLAVNSLHIVAFAIIAVFCLGCNFRQAPMRNPWKPTPVRFLINNPFLCSNVSQSSLDLLVIARSSPERKDRRDAIRRSWGHQCWTDRFRNGYKVAFLVGLPDSTEKRPIINSILLAESWKYHDIVQYNLSDNYFSLTTKMYAAWTYLTRYCTNYKFVFFADDDLVINPVNLNKKLHVIPDSQREHYIGGYLYAGLRTTRCPLMKNAVSTEQYPYSHYPPFVAGGAILMSIEMAQKLLNHLPRLEYMLPMEDVNIGQILRQIGEYPEKIPEVCLKDIDCNRVGIQDVIAIHNSTDTPKLMREWKKFQNDLHC